MTKVKINSIELTPIYVPFKEQVRKAMGESEGGLGMAIPSEEEWLGGDFVICKLICNDGTEGLGEAFVWLPETGISPNQIIESIDKYLGRYLLGENPFDIEKILLRMDNNVARNEVPKGLLDMACYDLMGKIENKPSCDFMGQMTVDKIPLTALIPLAAPILMKGIAKSYYRKGFRNFRYKLGRSAEEDVEISAKLRKGLGEDVNFRVDYNQAYTPEEAVKAINAIEKFNINVAEQPVKAEDYLGMAYVQKNVKIPLMAHEGFFSLRDLHSLVSMKAIGVLGINAERPGGVTNALKALKYAKENGIGVLLHNQPLGISSAMTIHFVAANFESIDYATELFGDVMMEDDLIKNPIDYTGGFAKVPEGPGLGVDLDEVALKKYATKDTIIINK